MHDSELAKPPHSALLESLLGVGDPERLYALLLERVATIDAFPGCNVMVLSPDRKELRFEHMRLPPGYERLEQVYLHTRIPLGSDVLAARALANDAATLLQEEDIRSLPQDVRTRLELMRVSAIASFPVRGRSRQLGALTLYKQDGGIAPETLAHVQALLDVVGPQLELALVLAEVRRQEQTLEAAARKQQDFLRFINTVNDLTSAPEIYQAIAQGLMALFPFDLVGFALREGDELVVKRLVLGNSAFEERFQALSAFYHANRYPLDTSGGGLAAAYEQNAPLVFADIQALGEIPMLPRDQRALELMQTPRTLLLTPIRRQSEPIGVMWLVSLEQPVTIDDADQALLDLLSSFVGTAIGNAQLYDLVGKQNQAIEELNTQLAQRVSELAVEASTDKLTGLHNFAFFEAELRRRVHEYERNRDGQQLSLVIFDVDHFKRLNDTYGHPAGNAVLQELSRRVRAVARKMDIPCRYGGEEFAVILPRCDLDGAVRFAERARSEIADTPVFVDGEYLALTISSGCATLRSGECAESLAERADQALYAAKHAGRNRVEAG